MEVLFVQGEKYARRDVFEVLGLPTDTWGGNWFTGYNEHSGEFFIFANVGIAGRTGHNYGNSWEEGRLRWYSKAETQLGQPQIKRLLDPDATVHVFRHSSSESPFVYAGRGVPLEVIDSSPVEILWAIEETPVDSQYLRAGEPQEGNYTEGTIIRVTVNAIERNAAARNACIAYYGATCGVCGFSFKERYGEVGRGYIEVHHLIPLATVTGEYNVHPVKDLRPTCPNCHAMIHRTNPPLKLDELRGLLRD